MVTVALVMLTVVSTAATLTGFWVHDAVVDRTGWNDTVAPLIDDDRVVAELSAGVTSDAADQAVAAILDVPLVPSSIERDAAARITDAVRPAVARALRTEAAAAVWRTATDRAHADVVAILRGHDSTFTNGRRVVVDLGPLAGAVVEAVTDGIDTVLDSLGVPLGFGLDLDLSLEVVLVDLTEYETSLAGADVAERRRIVFAVVALGAALALAARGRRRTTALTGVGACVVAGSAAFWVPLAASAPPGLDTTWQRLTGSADSYALAAGLAGAGLIVVSVGADRLLRARGRG